MKHKNDQQGAVSLITVIFIAILLTLITLAFLRLSVNEQRQATDDDLTNRAFYAAESGVEDAKVALEKYLKGDIHEADLNGNDCDPADSASGVLSSELEASYTCQYIDLTPASFEDTLAAWETVQIPLRGVSAYDQVVIRWHRAGADYDGPFNVRPSSDNNLLTVSNWSTANYPAMLRANFFSTPRNGNLNRSVFKDAAAFLNPASGGGGAITVPNAFDHRLLNANCNNATADGDFVCTATFSLIGDFDPASRMNYLRIQSIYRATTVSVQLLNSGASVDLEKVQAVVDVTGRANDVFRRVQARISLTGQDPYPFPDFAIITADNICKNFAVTDNPDDFHIINNIPDGTVSSCSN